MNAAVARTGALTWVEIGEDPKEEHDTLMAHPEAWGDVVLGRKETPTSYHLSVVVDDALQGVTHVVRGQDLQPATSVHRVLQALLGLPAPHYHHHRLVLDAEGRKLSKSTRATGLRELRADGATPADIRRIAGLSSALIVLVSPRGEGMRKAKRAKAATARARRSVRAANRRAPARPNSRSQASRTRSARRSTASWR